MLAMEMALTLLALSTHGACPRPSIALTEVQDVGDRRALLPPAVGKVLDDTVQALAAAGSQPIEVTAQIERCTTTLVRCFLCK